MMRRTIGLVVVGFVAACAGPKAPPPAAPVAAAPALAPARMLAPFQGELAAADGPTLEKACAARLDSARARIAALKALPHPVPRAEVDRAPEIYDESSG